MEMKKSLDLYGKRILLLEGNTLAKMIIDKAHALGMYVVIANWYSVEDAPAKAFADKEYTVNIFDIPAMMKIIREERIDGLFTAFTDSHLHI
jgi:formate-dependent phosphoribosylglycinamide formyltransferase (GAR transformylase)